jgi:death-on-curing protein
MEDAERAHARVLAEFGGSAGYIDRGLLESAVHAARNGYCTSLAEVAAAYLVGITLAHACVDGNKRLGVTCAGMFLRANGYPVRLDVREWEPLVLRVAEGRRGGADLDELRRDVAAAFVQVMGGPGAFAAEP